jgi:predicted PurR-regulated permease PerM
MSRAHERMRRVYLRLRRRKRRRRAGASSLDYVLVLSVTVPLAAVLMKMGTQIIQLAYEMVCALISWPFM